MSHPSAPNAVTCIDLTFEWPDGSPALTRLNCAFPPGRTGLIGRNGAGKSTLVRLVAGHLAPTSGRVNASGAVAFLPQTIALEAGQTVSDLLGIAVKRDALRRIESGVVDEAFFAVLGDDWDIEERAVAALSKFGINPQGAQGAAVLDRAVGTLSGGETVLTAIAGLMLRRAPVTVLDEPTNNLDRRARTLLYDAVANWPGVLIVASHDRELLDHMDQIAELRNNEIRVWGGNYSEYIEQRDAEQQAAERMRRVAEGKLAQEEQQLVQARIKLDRRVRYGKKMYANKREPKIVMGQRKRAAQESAGKHRIMHEGKIQAAKEKLNAAESAVRDDDLVRISLPATHVPQGQDVLTLFSGGRRLYVRGPERIALVGANGSGKTTLLEAIAGGAGCGPVEWVIPQIGYLPQRLDILDDASSVMDNIRAGASSATEQEVRAKLARFLITGHGVSQPAGTLSGGERFRVALARILLADEAPKLLLLDEPTNNLDLDSVEQLTRALSNYQGALLVASHDETLLGDIGVTRRWIVNRGTIAEE